MEAGGAEALRAMGREPPSVISLYVVGALGLVTAGLLITAGIGYLQQKRFLGRTVGTAYAVIAIITTVLHVAWVGENFGMFTLFYWVYPMLTLYFLYSVFRRDFVR